jgi:hypothetical protein
MDGSQLGGFLLRLVLNYRTASCLWSKKTASRSGPNSSDKVVYYAQGDACAPASEGLSDPALCFRHRIA